jgi:katanin p80 WD40 repeat-containing subunit B1
MPAGRGGRPFKFQEFAAHSGNVQCVSVGRRSFKVLATGGDDRKVNVWALGKPNALLSLSGHTTAVSSVCFDVQEEVVVGGATSGTIKLWDLDQGKAIRTLLGHRSDCLAVDFHPYGAFFVSGSLDTNLKVWDIRRKACIQTYKGHSSGLSVVRFSPDGKWVVSGDEDGLVKVWDLSAGKQLYEYVHDGAVTSLAFHPSELLMASGSLDRTARITDLDALKALGQTAPEGSGVVGCCFCGDGSAFFAVTNEHVKVWQHEPVVTGLDTVEVHGWGKLAGILRLYRGSIKVLRP